MVSRLGCSSRHLHRWRVGCDGGSRACFEKRCQSCLKRRREPKKPRKGRRPVQHPDRVPAEFLHDVSVSWWHVALLCCRSPSPVMQRQWRLVLFCPPSSVCFPRAAPRAPCQGGSLETLFSLFQAACTNISFNILAALG